MNQEEKRKGQNDDRAKVHQATTKEILEEFSEFPIPSYEEWRRVTEKTLKGAPFEKQLVTKTYEGIDLQPMYRMEDIAGLKHVHTLPGFSPYVRGAQTIRDPSKAWEISQETCAATPERFNEIARPDLGKGQTTLNMVLDEPTLAGIDADKADLETVGRDGLSISTLGEFRTALKGIDVSRVPLHVHTGALSLPFLSLVVAHFKEDNIPPKHLQGCLGMDPLGVLVREGNLSYDLDVCYDMLAAVTKWAGEHSPHLQTIIVSGHPYHNGGGSAVEELAFALATGVEYLRALQDRVVSAQEAAPKMCFSFSIGSQIFMEIAKFRAARLLWSTIVKAFGGDESAQKMYIHARTSAWTKTIYDPYVNMLRGTTEAFAGAVGGVDSMHVSTFDEPLQKSTDFSRRIARNTQIILQEESHLSRQIDPAGGSWYVEWLTDALAQKAWGLFQETEAKGGLLTALQDGFPQQQVARTAAKREETIKHRRDVFVGTNQYANIEEQPLTKTEQNETGGQETLDRGGHRDSQEKPAVEALRHDIAQWRKQKNQTEGMSTQDTGAQQNIVEMSVQSVTEGATLGDLSQALGRSTTLEKGPATKKGPASEKMEQPTLTIIPIPSHRGAEMFEEVRAASDAFLDKTGKRPQVFLANLGPIPEHKARADFAAGFFEVGGFEVLKNDGYVTVDSAAQAILQSEVEIVVICGRDEAYREMAPQLARQIKVERSSVTILLAGWPAEEERQAYLQAGVDDFIHRRSNCYDVLVRLQKVKGVVQ